MKFMLALAALLVLAATAHGRNINAEGLKLIKTFEGFRANFYGDVTGIRTIGYGHACHAADCSKIHAPITEAQGEALLHQDLVRFQACIDKDFPGIDDDKFAALVSFAFNLGCGVLPGSTLEKDMHAHNYRAAAAQFGAYVHAGGKVIQGLVRRRAAERALFCKSGGC